MDEGLKILFDLFKIDRTGHRIRNDFTEEELSLAKEQGYLFDYPRFESHADTYRRLQNILKMIDPQDISNAFLYSLSTRRLEYRSALGSYYYAKSIPDHEFMNSHNEYLAKAADHCYLCGWEGWSRLSSRPDNNRTGYNLYNYLRYKSGGFWLLVNVEYAIFDLEQFIKLPKVNPCEEDRDIIMAILACVDQLEPKDKVGKLRDTISKAKLFKTNREEISELLGELGICGILAGNDFPSYDIYFANEYERDPVEYKNDFAYPVNRWFAKDGINQNKLKSVLGIELT